MKIKITVTQEDIDKGVRQSECRCPIARATRRTLREARQLKFTTLEAQLDEIVLRDKDKIRTFQAPLPVRAQHFICRFDDSDPVKPFSFQINLLPAF